MVLSMTGFGQASREFKDKTISDDYKSGGAYKAMLGLFADHVSEEEYLEHCRRFFKGENENNT